MGTKPTSVRYPQGPATSSGYRDRDQSTEKSPSRALPSRRSEQVSVSRWEAEQGPEVASAQGSPGPSGRVRTAFTTLECWRERALRSVSPGGVIREGEAGHSLPGRSGRCRAEGSGQGVLMLGLWAPGGGGSHICSRAWTSRKNSSLHQGYSLNPPSPNHHLS